MKTIFYDDNIAQQANELLEDLADAVAGIPRCMACHQQFHVCACPDVVAAGLSPVGEGE